MFFRKRKKVKAIKLYSIGSEQIGIERLNLVESMFDIFENQFGDKPNAYVIHGPYGIKKGSSVGIRAFKNKLATKGHEKYDSLTGETEGELGFNISFGARLENQTYSELIIWWYTEHYAPSFEAIVKAVMPFYPISYGFELKTDDSVDVFSESKIKKSIQGPVSIEVTYKHLEWIAGYKSGELRGVFGKNILSEAQFKQARTFDPSIQFEKVGDKYFVYSGK